MTRWGSGRAKRLMNSTLPSPIHSSTQVVRVLGDHLPVAQRPRPDPRVGELLAVSDVELLRRAQRHHRRLHQVVVRGVGLLRRQALVGVATDSHLRQAREPLGILDHAGDVGVLGEHERIGPGRQAAALDAQNRGLAVQDLVRLVPVLLRAVAEQVDGVEVDGTRHRAEFVVDVLRIRRHARALPHRTASSLCRIRPSRTGAWLSTRCSTALSSRSQRRAPRRTSRRGTKPAWVTEGGGG